MLDSTPMPQLPQRGDEGVLNQGNGLTLRDQEAKLDQIQKDNFSLKLKIHYLEEALRKNGTSFQQQTLKENAVEQRHADVKALERELDLARQSGQGDVEEVQRRLQMLRAELEAEHAEAKQALEDEILVLESTFDDLQAEKAALE
ncbi:hypothetical protein BAUCODRAFT_57871, partial [Baudoinia panamericana UAMH 10762]